MKMTKYGFGTLRIHTGRSDEKMVLQVVEFDLIPREQDGNFEVVPKWIWDSENSVSMQGIFRTTTEQAKYIERCVLEGNLLGYSRKTLLTKLQE